MTRISKQQERRMRSPRKRHLESSKTGPKKDALPLGFKEHQNAAPNELAKQIYVAKIGK